ncbi:MAG: hypothetical protein QOE70_145 [Chthoniobacter sp.]|nr:hypothetical protein [Chthoniobacter sp.]
MPLRETACAPRLLVEFDYAIFLAPDGTLWHWGRDLGDVPVRLGKDSDWLDIRGDHQSYVALKADGTIWTRGDLLPPSGVKVSPNTPDGFQQYGDEDDWTAIELNWTTVAARKREGSLRHWQFGQSFDPSRARVPRRLEDAPKSVQAFTTTTEVVVGIDGDGRLGFWSPNHREWPPEPAPFSILDPSLDWVDLAPTFFEALAFKKNGSCWEVGMHVSRAYPSYEVLRSVGVRPAPLGDSGAMRHISGLFRLPDGRWWTPEGYDGVFLGCPPSGISERRTTHPPQVLPFRGDFWCVGHGLDTLLIFGRDGSLWSLGMRIGKPTPPAWTLFPEAFAHQGMRAFKKGWEPHAWPGKTVDDRPVKIWQWKPGLKAER